MKIIKLNIRINANSKFKKLLNIVNKISTNIKEDNISAYSAQCSYYTILSFIPFLILLITLIQYTDITQQNLFDIISKIVPENMNEFILGIVREVYSKSFGTISISILFTIWSAGRGLLALIKGLHSVYDIEDKKSNSILYLNLKSILETIIFIALIVLGIVLLVFGNTFIQLIQKRFNILKEYTILNEVIAKMFFIFITFIIFLILYKFVPNHKVTFKSQILRCYFRRY